MHKSWQIIIVCLRKAAHVQWCVFAVSACMRGFISDVRAHACAVFCPRSSSHPLEIAIPVHVWWTCSCKMSVLAFSHRSLSTYFVVVCCCIMAQLCNRLYSTSHFFFFHSTLCFLDLSMTQDPHILTAAHCSEVHTFCAPIISSPVMSPVPGRCTQHQNEPTWTSVPALWEFIWVIYSEYKFESQATLILHLIKHYIFLYCSQMRLPMVS